ncbi:adenosylmethionine--8-amino-7-oxononanoate transaminase [Helicobacter cappadocius]|uniref:Adenosylmethionine-8-amino-7-oxononanoate aminotransferase n=1 Tax=Helicobacter cappadocius TaxID=3063998 RepID=A0AA90PJ39_9HELI|nr:MULTISPECIES: adenosylmethionine--8-amino-7-oxononanoate transaminase [unclassified Helicobacter]MDO7253103.1 adenosylmethionine--8-amino-7-oxononanoate transaminase [Helicobacter sp. faydin-H75]MDP2538771.1 adenosylmethionine--8-amino-7-oxononanoate transaminase [Helicobacter sp. faydin-H76]
MNTKQIIDLDMKSIWHPCTQMKDHEKLPIVPIKSGKGVYLYDFENRAYIDCVSSWWVNLFGHSNDYINSKLKEQIDTLEHVILAGFTHEGIVKLSDRLINLTPKGLDKCFYADNGSSAVEVALKMSYHVHLLDGKKRFKFLSLSNSYHGETIGALSVGAVELYKKTYSPILIECVVAPVPQNDGDVEFALKELEKILDKEGENISAFILEPLIQCAGNMHIYSNFYVKKAVQMCQERGIYVIFDEIAVGFGRTGTLFAYEQCEVVPDFLCLSKGITAGYMPLSVVMMSDDIYQKFYAPYEHQKAFLHSHSYTGNALACACANATLDIFENENVIDKNKELSKFIIATMNNLSEIDFVANMRYKGMVFAFDLVGFAPNRRVGLEVFEAGLRVGILLRPLGNTIYFMPPYVITHDQIKYVFDSLKTILKQIKY